MNSLYGISSNVMWKIVKNVNSKEIAQLMTVNKEWSVLLSSDYIIRKLIKLVFPLYNIEPHIPVQHQYKQLNRVPLNIANGDFSLKDVEMTSEMVYEGPAGYEASIFLGLTIWVKNPELKIFHSCEFYPDQTFDLFQRPSISDVQFTLDGTKMIAGSTDGALKVWDLFSGECLQTLLGHTGAVKAVRILSDGNYAVSASSNREIKIWNLLTGGCLKTFTVTPEIEKIEIMDDQNKLFLNDRNNIYLVDLRVATCVSILQFEDTITSMVISPDKKILLVNSASKRIENVIHVINTKALRIVKGISFPNGVVHHKEHGEGCWGMQTSTITSIQFSIDGTKLILRSLQPFNRSEFRPYANILDFLKLDESLIGH